MWRMHEMKTMFLVLAAAATLPLTAQVVTVTFNYTGAAQSFTVPSGVTSITAEAHGAQGGSSTTGTGGKGGRMAGAQGEIV